MRVRIIENPELVNQGRTRKALSAICRRQKGFLGQSLQVYIGSRDGNGPSSEFSGGSRLFLSSQSVRRQTCKPPDRRHECARTRVARFEGGRLHVRPL